MDEKKGNKIPIEPKHLATLGFAKRLFIRNYQKILPEESCVFNKDKWYEVVALNFNTLNYPSPENDPDVQNREFEIICFVADQRSRIVAINLFACEVSTIEEVELG